MKSYTGIGSRNITESEIKIITKISNFLSNYFICYSGNADGSDITFQKSSNGNHISFLPWDEFNFDHFKPVNYYVVGHLEDGINSIHKFHPNPNALSSGAKKLMARNYYQIRGYLDYPTVSFVVCCADEDINGNILGGTGQACRIAKSLNIPIFNIRNENWKNNFNIYLKE